MTALRSFAEGTRLVHLTLTFEVMVIQRSIWLNCITFDWEEVRNMSYTCPSVSEGNSLFWESGP